MIRDRMAAKMMTEPVSIWLTEAARVQATVKTSI